MSSVPPRKTVTSSSFGTTKHVTFDPGPGPSLPASLTFTVPLLAGSLARAMALSTANAATISTLTQGFHHLLDGLIDPAQTDLAFVQDIETLGDSLRTAFSGFLGAGIADLYMLQLGHAFRCNGRELYRKKGKIFDFAYDSGPVIGNDVVAVEAKGLVRRGATKDATEKATKKGYDTQIDQHLGKTLSGAKVVRGYAIGIGCMLKKRATGHLHVQETEWSTAGAGPISPLPSRRVGTGGGRQVRNQLALRNFGAIFRLMGNGGILGAIDAALNGRLNPEAFFSGRQRLTRVSWRNRDYFATIPDAALSDSQQAFHASFGVRCDAADTFFRGLQQRKVRDARQDNFPFELRVNPLDISREIHMHDRGAEFPDGLAYFGHSLLPRWGRVFPVSNVRVTYGIAGDGDDRRVRRRRRML